MKQFSKYIFYELVIYFLKFQFFKKISNIFVNAYFIEKGYCFDWFYLKSKSSNNLFKGENIFISKFDNLKIKNCIDIGCNSGDYSKEILNNKYTNVIAFEPLPICQEDLKTLSDKYNQRFVNFNFGLSNVNGQTEIKYNPKKSGLASVEKSIIDLTYVNKENKIKTNVEIRKLDNFTDDNKFKYIDFIKIDTEGHEFKILEGGLNLIKKNNVKMIQIEFNWHHLFTNNTIKQFSNILDNYVATQLDLISGKLIQIDKNHYFSNIFQLSNFIFVEKNFFIQNKDILIK